MHNLAYSFKHSQLLSPLQNSQCCQISFFGITWFPKHVAGLDYELFHQWTTEIKANGFCNHSHRLGRWLTSKEPPAP